MGFMAAVAAVLCWAPASAQQPSASQQEYMKRMAALQQSLHPATGDVTIPEAKAVLHLGSSYYFLPAEEARRVLVDAWGNHPDDARDVLGLVIPAGKTFLDDVWGAVITYDAMGYVSDEDAHSADYDKILADLKSGEDEENAERTKQGYPATHLVGWAEPPHYDQTAHSVVWARNIQVDGHTDNSLNYDVRLLGRYGVLSLNMISGMSQLGDTRQAAGLFAGTAEFTSGSRYADYQPGVDKEAGIGIAGLVAAGIGVAAAKKLGLLAVILAFGKKFIILIVAAGAAIAARFRRLFGRNDDFDSGAAAG
jgi:uncharacterized membrane-anchored protein